MQQEPSSEDDVPLPRHAVSVEEAARIFTHPPLLAFAEPLNPGGRMIAFAGAVPDQSSATIAWQRHPSSSWKGVDGLDRGDDFFIQIVARIRPDYTPWEPINDDKPVKVRSHNAYMAEQYRELHSHEERPWRSEGRRDLRVINWSVQKDNHWVVSWSVFNHSRTYSEEETLRILESMREVMP